jgi:hypothetical protein
MNSLIKGPTVGRLLPITTVCQRQRLPRDKSKKEKVADFLANALQWPNSVAAQTLGFAPTSKPSVTPWLKLVRLSVMFCKCVGPGVGDYRLLSTGKARSPLNIQPRCKSVPCGLVVCCHKHPYRYFTILCCTLSALQLFQKCHVILR